jgi:large subunit ribosomal protein L21e
MFSRGYRKNGMPAPATYLRTFRVGDIVDVVANSAIQKGMPHKFYHGKTGRVWNVTKRAVGVVMNKVVGNRIMAKKLHVRVEHVQHSKCRVDFLNRVRSLDAKKLEAKKAGIVLPESDLKRYPGKPKEGELVRVKKSIHTTAPVPYDITRFV